MAKPTFDDPYFLRAGFVYFIAAGGTAVKIGTTGRQSFKRRLTALQSSNHEQLEVIGVIPFLEGKKPMLDAERRERELHRLFSEFQRFPDGQVGYEWFSWTEKLLDFIHEKTEPPEKFKLPRSVAKRRS